MSILLEVCANSVASALAGQDGGAQRIELCENLPVGGTTPSHADIAQTRKQLHIELNVLVRPRGGDFLYDDTEFKVMVADVKYCVEAGCDGIVIGILNTVGSVDKERCSKLIKIAKQHNLSVTFHRAFDVCNDMFKAMEDIIEMGCDRILTSGGKDTATEGSTIIAQLIEKATGRIIILPGSGINEKNVANLVKFTKATEVHSSARIGVDSDITDAGQVKLILQIANR